MPFGENVHRMCYGIPEIIEEKEKEMKMEKKVGIVTGLVSVLLISFIMVVGCAEPTNVMQVCTKNRGGGNSCASGFFIASDTLVTAGHLMDNSKNGELFIREPGINTKTKNITYIEGKDVLVAKFDHNVTEDICPLCDTVEDGANVELLGVLKSSLSGDDIERKLSKIEFIEDDMIWMDIQLKGGFSGGAVVDIDKEYPCVIGMIAVHSEDFYLGAEIFLKSDASSLKLED